MSDDEASASSALRDNIAKKGKNAYYYAHAHNADGPKWNGDCTPQLLSTTNPSAASAATPAPVAAVTNYAWADEKPKLKIYVPFEGVGALPEGAVELDWTARTVTLTITAADAAGTVHKLNIPKLYDDVTAVKVKTKPDKLILVLTKSKECSWYELQNTK